MQRDNAKSKIFFIRKRRFSFFTFRFKFNSGFGLIEILITSAILSASLIVLTTMSYITFRLMKESFERTQASFLSEEAIEVVRALRDSSYSGNIAPLSLNTVHYPIFSTTTSSWSLSTSTSGLIYSVFDRTVVFDEVYRRNSDSEIVSADSSEPKTLDPDTRKVTARVSWEAPSGTKDVTIETYVSNLFNN